MPPPTLSRLSSSVQYYAIALIMFKAITLGFSPGNDVMTDLKNTVASFLMENVLPWVPINVQYFDTVLFGLQLSVWGIPKIYTAVKVLTMIIIVGMVSLPAIPWFGKILNNDQEDVITNVFNENVDARVEQGDVYLAAAVVLLPTYICLSFFAHGGSVSQIVLFKVPDGYEKYAKVIWFVFQMGLGYSTILEKDYVEECFGSGYFFAKEVAFLILNQLLTLQRHPSCDLGNGQIWHFLKGTLWMEMQDGKKMGKVEYERVYAAMGPLRQVLWTPDAKEACSVNSAEIDVKKPGPRQKLYKKISSGKQLLSQTYNSNTQMLSYNHTFALNFVPNAKLLAVFVLLTIYVIALDVSNFSSNKPLLCVNFGQAMYALRSNATSDAVQYRKFAADMNRDSTNTCPVLQNETKTADKANPGNHTDRHNETPNTNTNNETADNQVPSDGMENSTGGILPMIAYGAGTVVASAFGYGLYFFFTQG